MMMKASTTKMILRHSHVAIKRASILEASNTSRDRLMSTLLSSSSSTSSLSSTFDRKKDESTSSISIGSVRYLSRKGSKMGHHLETIEDMAYQERRKHKKKNKSKDTQQQQHDNDNTSEASSSSSELMEHDETETIFEHGGNDNDEDTLPTLPSSSDVKDRMTNVVSSLQNAFRSIRGSEPTPELFESIPVQAYDTTMPLSSLAQVIISTPTRVLLNCFDPSTVGAVRDAVRDNGNLKNVNPQVDENDKGTIVVPMPRPSAETRKNVAKELAKQTEVAKQRIRRIRRAAQDVVKKGKDGKMEGISKDDAFRVGKEIDVVTEEVGKMLDEVLKKKTEDVMAV